MRLPTINNIIIRTINICQTCINGIVIHMIRNKNLFGINIEIMTVITVSFMLNYQAVIVII